MNPYHHLDYREVIRAWLAENRGWMSLREMARRLGCSASWISQILKNKRDLDPARIEDFAELMGLTPDQRSYFADLVELDSGNRVRRDAAWTRISAVRRFATSEQVSDDAVRLFTHWIWGAVWQLSLCDGFRDEPEWIAAALMPPVSPAMARDALDGLLSLGLLERVRGRLVGVPDTRATPPVVPPGALSDAVLSWHQHHLRNLADRLEHREPRRHVQGITFAFPTTRFDELTRRITELNLQLLSEVDGAPDADQVFHLQVGLVQVTRPTETAEAPAPPSRKRRRTGSAPAS